VNEFPLAELPPPVELETKTVLRQAAAAHRYLAELKGVSKTIPNQNILISTLPLLEAKDSSAIENIITTHDELYKKDIFGDYITNAAAKEVRDYATALRTGYEIVRKTGLLSVNRILQIQEVIEKNNAGLRTLPGTELKNDQNGETIYIPPQKEEDIFRLMKNLEAYIHDQIQPEIYPLIKMTVIHYQFESIHPFYDGNGRTGRILNILYLVQKGLLDIPVLYLSRYIIRTKDSYYRMLQKVREDDAWEEWLLYLLKGMEETAKETIDIITQMRNLMQDYKQRIRSRYKFYSQDLLNSLFSHPYTKVEHLKNALHVSRQTAAKYLDQLAEDAFLNKEKIGKQNYYVNSALYALFTAEHSR
jgi:Fic family protein